MADWIAVIIVNWNGLEDTRKCLRSLGNSKNADWRAVVVDNGSKGDDVSTLTREFPGALIIEAGQNLGFAGGCNRGIRMAMQQGASHFFLLNNDAELVGPDVLSNLRDRSDGLGVAAVGPLIVYRDAPERVWFAGGKVNAALAKVKHVGMNQAAQNVHGVTEVGYVSGCAMMLSRASIEKNGLFDESFFLYFEETDWCLRARQSGSKLLVDRNLRVIHGVSASMKRTSGLLQYYFFRSWVRFARRWSGWIFPVALVRILAAASLQAAYQYVTGHGRAASLIGLGIRHGFSDDPRMMGALAARS